MPPLVIAEHDNSTIKGATLNTITAALACNDDVQILVAGSDALAAAQAASCITVVSRVILADAPQLDHGLAENIAAQIVSIAHDFSHIPFPSSASGKNITHRVAPLLNVSQISDAIRVIRPDTLDRPIYAGNAIATVQSSDPIKITAVRTTAFEAPSSEGGNAPIGIRAAVADTGLSTFINNDLAKSDRPELTAAKVVVSGRALGSNEQFLVVLNPLADKLDAALGASRAAVDAGYASNDLQVGQTGKIVAPTLYIACGISGAIQHLAGMKDAKVIVAINKDPDASIFSIADYCLEADLFDKANGRTPAYFADAKRLSLSND